MNEQFPGVRPLFLVKPKAMSRRDINRAEKMCGICIVECSSPDESRYSEPPITANLDDQARAALSLMRRIIVAPGTDFKRGDLTRWFIEELIRWDNKPKQVEKVKT